MSDHFGEIVPVDVRTAWPSESANFTPWLAKEENIAKLGQALGLELEVEHTEVAVGPYSADILARDSGGDYVVIENQLGKTDHDHLGKAIAYASVLGASIVVWIATQFTDEHKKALDWLNEHSDDELSFFGVQVELWSIDSSRPAVRFNLVSRPAEIVRQAASVKTGDMTETRQLQLEWWTAFRDELVARKSVPSARSPRPQYWYDIALGRTGIHLSNVADTSGGRIGVRVYIRNKHGGHRALEQLMESKEAIEREIGQTLSWNPNPNTIDKVIAIYKSSDLSQKSKWPEMIDWMIDMTEKFRKTFAPRIRALDLEREEEPTA